MTEHAEQANYEDTLLDLEHIEARCKSLAARRFSGPPGAVLQDWVGKLSFMQQTVLLTAIRGPDGVAKYNPPKMLLRWFRRCVLISALEQGVILDPVDPRGGSFNGPSVDLTATALEALAGASFVYDRDFHGLVTYWGHRMDAVVGDYLRNADAIPAHFQSHFMHACEILGYKHPNKDIRRWWNNVYIRLVHDLHLFPETEAQLDARLGDSREGWLSRSDPATVN